MREQQQTEDLYAEMEHRLEALEPKDYLKFRRDAWVIGAMLTGMAMTGPSILGMKNEVTTWLSLVGLVIELSALAVFCYRQFRDVKPDFIDARKNFAIELDRNFFEYEALLAWLRTLPEDVRAIRLRYIESRLEAMGERYPMLFGAADKLGILPLLAAIFLQLQAVKSVSLTMGVFGAVLIMLYCMGMWLARHRLQMQTYVRLLRLAAQ